MRFKKTAALLGAAALAGMAGPAFAGSPFAVSVPGTDTTYSAPSKSSIQFVVHHGASNVNMGCTSASASGNVLTGSQVLTVANITGSSWTSCIGPGGLAMTVAQNGTWTINAEAGNTSGSTDVVTGYIGNVSATVTATANPALCSFTVTGSADGSFYEQKSGAATGQTELKVNETGGARTLTVSNVTGCLGLIANGDKADFVGDFNPDLLGIRIN